MVETLSPLQENHEAFKEGATFKSAPYWLFSELHLPAGLLELAGRLRLFYCRGLLLPLWSLASNSNKRKLKQ